jgi:hypothetical protein
MILTHRRRNLCEAWIITGLRWASIEDLRAAGAYGTKFSIHRAFRRMLEHHAVVIKATKDGPKYAFTQPGLVAFGKIPKAQAGAANGLG